MGRRSVHDGRVYSSRDLRDAVDKIKSFQGKRETAIRIEEMLLQSAMIMEEFERRGVKFRTVTTPEGLKLIRTVV